MCGEGLAADHRSCLVVDKQANRRRTGDMRRRVRQGQLWPTLVARFRRDSPVRRSQSTQQIGAAMAEGVTRVAERRGTIRTVVLALLAGLFVALLAALPAYAEFTPGGGVSARVDPRTGFPSMVRGRLRRAKGQALRRQPTVPRRRYRPNRTRPASLTVDANPGRPGLQPNMPDEAFYAVSRAETELDAGGRIRWRGVLEGAYGSPKLLGPGARSPSPACRSTGSNIDLAAHPPGAKVRDPIREPDGTGERGRYARAGP